MNSSFLGISLLLILTVALVNGQSTVSVPRNVRVVTILTPDLQLVSQNADGTLSGFIIELLDLIAARAGFTYTTFLQPDATYGSLRPDGTWDGLVGTLIAGQADIAAADLTITAEREEVIDFTSPYAQSPLVILTNVEFGLNNVRYLTQSGTSFVEELRLSTVPAVQAIWADIQANNGLVATIAEAVERVLAGGFALVSDRITALPYVLANPTRLRFNGTCDDIISNTYLALGLQLGSAWRDPVSIAISQINESGQLQSLLVKYRLV